MKDPTYLGMTIKHDKVKETITYSMSGYIDKVLARFLEWAGISTAESPGVYNAPQYGAKVQYALTNDTERLSKPDIKAMQEIDGLMLYYARAVNPTMLTNNNNNNNLNN
jgi:hypothetical protein